jgi:hypothetical protein
MNGFSPDCGVVALHHLPIDVEKPLGNGFVSRGFIRSPRWLPIGRHPPTPFFFFDFDDNSFEFLLFSLLMVDLPANCREIERRRKIKKIYIKMQISVERKNHDDAA